MRLYKKVKPILSGVTADKTHKGVLLTNPASSGFVAPCLVNIRNYDGSISQLSFDVPQPLGPFQPSWFILPMNMESWTDQSSPGSSVTANVYLLY